MTHWVDEVLRRYGQEAAVEREEGLELVRAFLQPVAEREEHIPEAEAIGWLDGRRWLYLGKAAVEAGDTLVWNGQRFHVRSGRPHYIGSRLSHWRAVLERTRETE